MKKDIKKLLLKEHLTGDEAGRLMILDLLVAYEDITNGGGGRGVVSDEEKLKIVRSLTHPDDVRRFNDFKGVHDYLTTVSGIYESYAKTYEVCHLRFSQLVYSMSYAEKAYRLFKQCPVIMTKKQYSHFLAEEEAAPAGGIAVLQDIPARLAEDIDENGFYVDPRTKEANFHMAENILNRYSRDIREARDVMRDMLAECLARRKALELIGRYIKIPAVKGLVYPIDEKRLEVLDSFVAETIRQIRRYDGQEGEYEEQLKAGLKALMPPIDPAALAPSEKDVIRARRMLNFSVIKNGSEAFISVLRRKWRDDTGE